MEMDEMINVKFNKTIYEAMETIISLIFEYLNLN